MQGSELVKLDSTDEYPLKLKKLMKEVQFAKVKQSDLKEKLSFEHDVIVR